MVSSRRILQAFWPLFEFPLSDLCGHVLYLIASAAFEEPLS